jgi:hypothetical protein
MMQQATPDPEDLTAMGHGCTAYAAKKGMSQTSQEVGRGQCGDTASTVNVMQHVAHSQRSTASLPADAALTPCTIESEWGH